MAEAVDDALEKALAAGSPQSDDQEVLDRWCSELSERPHLALPLLEWMIPDLAFPPAKSLTGPGSRRFVGTISNIHPEKGFSFLTCPEATEIFGIDVFLHSAQRGAFQVHDEVNFAVLLNKDGKPQAFDLTPASSSSVTPIVSAASWKGWQKGEEKGWQKGGPAVAAVAHKGWQKGEDKGWQKGEPAFAQKGSPMSGLKGGIVSGQKGAQTFGKGGNAGMGDRLTGTITAFLPHKNFGFIQCEEISATYGKDLWLHGDQKGSFDIGDTVSFSLIFNKEGSPQAIDLAPPKPKGQSVKPPVKRPSPEDAGGSDRHVGSITAFYPAKNFGFIACDETFALYGKDLWVHGAQVGDFSVGATVSFSLILNKDGNPQAVDLQAADGRAAKWTKQY